MGFCIMYGQNLFRQAVNIVQNAPYLLIIGELHKNIDNKALT